MLLAQREDDVAESVLAECHCAKDTCETICKRISRGQALSAPAAKADSGDVPVIETDNERCAKGEPDAHKQGGTTGDADIVRPSGRTMSFYV
ncbi:MAG: hypothetical protein OWU32_09130 [Firmicutes bacterium]|nr:hypothetical protein [Bacillota bacterium]